MSAPPSRILTAAKRAKADEYYTQWADVEREMRAYLEYDANVFRDKAILLPCDDPSRSNFTKFFVLHFAEFGIKKLISTSYAAADTGGSRGEVFTLDAKSNQRDYLSGTGDFNSAEVVELRDEADIIITNPPFSRWRSFFGWLIESGKKFAIIGNQNAITYKDVFPHIQENRVWLGKGFPRNMAHFNTPYTPYGKWIEQGGEGVVRVPGVQWFTNIEHGRRHEPMQLMTIADNLKFNKRLITWLDGETTYQRYDNFDAIEVPFTDAIPSDYDGVMGVPVTWLAKYNPDQFEILFSADDMEQTEAAGVEPLGQKRVDDYYAAGGTGGNSRGHRKLFLYHPRPWVPYKRIAVCHSRP